MKKHPLKELREVTGAGITLCSSAWKESGEDFEKAVSIIRVKSKAKASKRMDREVSEGTIKTYFSPEDGVVSCVTVRCETDFVAKSQIFQDFAHNVLMNVHKMGASYLDEQEFCEQRQQCIVATGENIDVDHAVRYPSLNADNFGLYEHPFNVPGIVKKASFVLFDGCVDESLRKSIAMHIVASHPLYLSIEDVPAEVIEKEKSLIDEQQKLSEKPDHIAEKIREGALKKFFQTSVLLEQSLVTDTQHTVREAIGEVSIRTFHRWSL